MTSLNLAGAQAITGRTDEGKRIILNSNGTWKYDKQDTTTRSNCSELANKLAEQTKLTLIQEKLAIANEERVIQLEKAAMKSKYLSISKAMALMSREEDDPELKGLVALQAYHFNLRSGGNSFDNDIYEGMNAAIEKFKLIKSPDESAKKDFESPKIATSKIPTMASELAAFLTRNMTKDEWQRFTFGLPYESTCPNFPPNNK